MTDDQITQKSVIALIDLLESAGPVSGQSAEFQYPRTWKYCLRHRWVTTMGNGIARATVFGIDVVRFSQLAKGDAS